MLCQLCDSDADKHFTTQVHAASLRAWTREEAPGLELVWRFELRRLLKANSSHPRLESIFWHSVVRPNLGTGSSAAAIAAAMEGMLATAQLPEPTPKVPKVAAPLLPIPGTDLPHYGVSGL